MRIARWRWVLAPMVVVVAGCLPKVPTPDLPESFLANFNGTGQPTFTVQSPPASLSWQAVADGLRADDAMFRHRAVPVFGIVDCHGIEGCMPGPSGNGGATTWAAWLLLYPDCIGRGGMGWVLVDSVKIGAAGILRGNSACDL
jgi:hypothetical protein